MADLSQAQREHPLGQDSTRPYTKSQNILKTEILQLFFSNCEETKLEINNRELIWIISNNLEIKQHTPLSRIRRHIFMSVQKKFSRAAITTATGLQPQQHMSVKYVIQRKIANYHQTTVTKGNCSSTHQTTSGSMLLKIQASMPSL